MNKNYLYYAEGENDLKLLNSLKIIPARIAPGKTKKLNVIQNLIPKSVLISIKPGTTVALAFDTDVMNTKILKKNISNIRKYCHKVKIVYLMQVKNLEDELVRSTDINNILELMGSRSLNNYKSDFNKMNEKDCRHLLERHKLDTKKLWISTPPCNFSFLPVNSDEIKL